MSSSAVNSSLSILRAMSSFATASPDSLSAFFDAAFNILACINDANLPAGRRLLASTSNVLFADSWYAIVQQAFDAMAGVTVHVSVLSCSVSGRCSHCFCLHRFLEIRFHTVLRLLQLKWH